MKRALLELLACPACGGPLELAVAAEGEGEVESGTLRCAGCAAGYPVEAHIPRFVPRENYADSFGLQWNAFRRTQLDSHSGRPISRNRFYLYTGWTPEELRGKRVLDVGCGAGRFAEVALEAGATVVALDYSAAADACWANLRQHPGLHVVQGDVYRLPFRPHGFDFVYCLGVLQHTPDVEAAFAALPRQARKGGGKVAVDLYPRLPLNALWPKYWLRPLTRRLPPARLFALVQRGTPVLLPLSRALGRVPVIGRRLRHAVPVANYEGVYPLDERQLREWAVLDTYDMLAPKHDHPQTAGTLRAWFEEAGLAEVEVVRSGFLVGRGTQP